MRLNCPICDSAELEPVLHRQNVPVLENAVYDTREAARAVERGDIDLVFCANCDIVFNGSYESSKLKFDAKYDPSAAQSKVFGEYIDDLARYLIEDRGVRDVRVVEVGCGKGDFLRRLAKLEPGIRAIGFDTVYEGPRSDFDGRLVFEQRYLGNEDGAVQADVAIALYVLDYIVEPVPFLRRLRDIVVQAAFPRAFVECRNLVPPMQNHAFWDFPYETFAFHSQFSLTKALRAAGLLVSLVRPVFDGQRLLAEAHPGDSAAPGPIERDASIPALVASFRASEYEYRERWAERLRNESARGGIALWGAAAKGVAMANLVDPDCSFLRCLVDINPQRQGRFVAGSGHSIVAPQSMRDLDVQVVYVMNPIYRNEVAQMVQELRLDVRVDVVGRLPHGVAN